MGANTKKIDSFGHRGHLIFQVCAEGGTPLNILIAVRVSGSEGKIACFQLALVVFFYPVFAVASVLLDNQVTAKLFLFLDAYLARLVHLPFLEARCLPVDRPVR